MFLLEKLVGEKNTKQGVVVLTGRLFQMLVGEKNTNKE
jgi:hypothetical protein